MKMEVTFSGTENVSNHDTNVTDQTEEFDKIIILLVKM